MQTLDAAQATLDNARVYLRKHQYIIPNSQSNRNIVPQVDNNEREGLLTTIRARRKWYLGLYFLQIVAWLLLLVVTEVYNVESTDIMGQRVLGAAVTMSFIGQGTLGSVDI